MIVFGNMYDGARKNSRRNKRFNRKKSKHLVK